MHLGVNLVPVKKAVNLPVGLRKIYQNAEGGYYKSKCKQESTNPSGILIACFRYSVKPCFPIWGLEIRSLSGYYGVERSLRSVP